MSDNFDLSNMPDDVQINADGETTATVTGTASCGKKPLFVGKRRTAYDECMTKEQQLAADKELAKDADLASAKALAESVSAQVQSLQADADMRNSESIKELADAATEKDAAEKEATKKAELATYLKNKSTAIKGTAEKFEADKAALMAGQDNEGGGMLIYGLLGVAAVIGVYMLWKKMPKSLPANA